MIGKHGFNKNKEGNESPKKRKKEGSVAEDERLLSIVIGSYNRKRLLQKTIESVFDQRIRIPVEMIVVDGGSDDGTLEWLVSQKNIITIVQHNRGEWNGMPIVRRSWGYFMNLGFKIAQGKYILMISDDCLLLPNAVNRGLDTFENGEREGRKVGGVAFYFRNWPVEKNYYVQKTLGGKLMVNHGLFLRKAVEEIGWVDEDHYLFYKADGDLSLKIWEAGYQIQDCPGSMVEHFYDENEAVRLSNNAVLKKDQKTYLDRWEGVFYFKNRPDGRGCVFSSYMDLGNTAEKRWKECGFHKNGLGKP